MSAIEGFRQFKSPGPVATAYLMDRTSKVKALRGPVGGGKTVTNIYDGLRAASCMPPCNDGVIRYRRALIGVTYGQLERNLYPSWKRWLPDDDTSFTPDQEWKGGGGRSATHKINFDVLPSTPYQVEFARKHGLRLIEARTEFIFAAIGEAVAEEFMRGFEPTDILMIEADQLDVAVMTVGVTRLGRYPATGDAPDAVPFDVPFHSYIGMDLNSPDTDSWFFEIFEERKPDGFKVYAQPSGLSPHAENRRNLRPDYYETMVQTLLTQRNGKNLVKRMVHNQYAPSLQGEPVYDGYDDAVHLAPEPLKPLPGVPIRIGFDQGLQRPAAVFGQRASTGQYRIIGECMPGRMSARRFCRHVRNWLETFAPGVPLDESHDCDPAGFTGADKEDDEMAWAEIVAAELDIVIQPAETNELDARITAVSDELSFMIEPGVPAYLLSPACKINRRGKVSKYRYPKSKVSGNDRTGDKPEKNDEANVADAEQYLFLGWKGRVGVIRGRQDPDAPERAIGRRKKRAGDDAYHVLKAPVEV